MWKFYNALPIHHLELLQIFVVLLKMELILTKFDYFIFFSIWLKFEGDKYLFILTQIN